MHKTGAVNAVYDQPWVTYLPASEVTSIMLIWLEWAGSLQAGSDCYQGKKWGAPQSTLQILQNGEEERRLAYLGEGYHWGNGFQTVQILVPPENTMESTQRKPNTEGV